MQSSLARSGQCCQDVAVAGLQKDAVLHLRNGRQGEQAMQRWQAIGGGHQAWQAICACSLAASHCCGFAARPGQPAGRGGASKRSSSLAQGVLGCSMHPSQRGNVDSCLCLPVVWQRDCLWMQSWVGVPVDTTSSLLTAGLKGTCQEGGGRHGAPVAHPGSCKPKPCMTRLVVLHITVRTSACNTVVLFCYLQCGVCAFDSNNGNLLQ